MMRVKPIRPTDEPEVGSGLGRPGQVSWPSSAHSGLLWLLRFTGQAGGTGCLARLYALVLYILLAVGNIYAAVMLARIGVTVMRKSVSFFDVAFSTYFFGAFQALSVLPLTATAVSGRRRFTVLLSDVRALMEEMTRSTDVKVQRKPLTRKLYILLAVGVALMIVMPYLTYLMMKSSLHHTCTLLSVLACVSVVGFYLAMAITPVAMLLMPVKFLYITMLLGSCFRAIDVGVQLLARDGGLTDWTHLARLRALQDRLSTVFSRLVTDTTPELILSTLYGLLSLVMSFLVLFQSALAGTLLDKLPLLFFMLLGVVFVIVVPCEAGQHVLDLITSTRGSLLRLHWKEPRIGQEVAMLQEAVCRDLDHLGDLGYYRLQRSTMVGILSTVITYIVIFLQFSMSEA